MRLKPATLYTIFYIAQFLFLGVNLPFFPGWLNAEGFGSEAIGLIMGVGLVLRLLLAPMVAYWAESLKDQRMALWWVSGLMFASIVAMLLNQPLWSIAIFTILTGFAFGCMIPLTDTAVLRADKAGLLHYGKARGLGSFAFICANLAGGMVIQKFGGDTTVIWMAVTSLSVLLVSFYLPKVKSETDTDETVIRPSLAVAARLIKSPSFVLLLIAVGLTQGTHATYYTFSNLHWTALGYSNGLIGILWAVGVFAEIIVLYYAHILTQRVSPVILILIGAAGALVRWPLTGLSPPLYILVLLQAMHALTFAFTYIGSIQFISRAVPTNLTNTAMTIVSALGVGAMVGIAAVCVGYIFDEKAPFTAYASMGGMGFVAIIAAIALNIRWDGGIIRTERDKV